jgi:hypothetical protein
MSFTRRLLKAVAITVGSYCVGNLCGLLFACRVLGPPIDWETFSSLPLAVTQGYFGTVVFLSILDMWGQDRTLRLRTAATITGVVLLLVPLVGALAPMSIPEICSALAGMAPWCIYLTTYVLDDRRIFRRARATVEAGM